MTPAPTPVKSLKTTYNGHLVKRRNTEVFSLDLLIPTTCHSKKLKFRPPMEKPRPALRGGVAGRGTRKRPPAFILHIFRPLSSPATFGSAEFAGWRTPATRFGHGCVCDEGRRCYLPDTCEATQRRTGCDESLPLFTATQFLRTPILLFVPLVIVADFGCETPALPGMDRWCRADCHCA